MKKSTLYIIIGLTGFLFLRILSSFAIESPNDNTTPEEVEEDNPEEETKDQEKVTPELF